MNCKQKYSDIGKIFYIRDCLSKDALYYLKKRQGAFYRFKKRQGAGSLNNGLEKTLHTSAKVTLRFQFLHNVIG